MYDYWDEDDYRATRFADPGGISALHPGAKNYPCPTCGEANRLTGRDVQAGYQCNGCANTLEFGY